MVCAMVLSGWLWIFLGASAGIVPSESSLEVAFRELPNEARRLTGPLFWLHGDESPELLEAYVAKVAEGGNGCFTAESRPHEDWLGPGWYRDLAICLNAAKRHDLKMYIFDERWWPSGEVAGRVPKEYASKYLEASSTTVEGPRAVDLEVSMEKLVAVLAGRRTPDGVDRHSLIELTDRVQEGRFTWDAPGGSWQVMTFSWRFADLVRGRYLIDGASQSAVDWYLETVYQPHHDRFAADFGDTIVGFFYDEPETHGDWGTELLPMLAERGADWKAALVAWKFQLAGDDQVAARYQYQDALAEAWGRTLYGGITRWCRDHGVESIGHFLEHSKVYLSQHACAGNMFQLQKYSSVGGIDAVFSQFRMGDRIAGDAPTWQTPKLGSSIAHAYGMRDDLAMVEIFGARGQDLSYREMKWWTDHMHVSGINFHIPHAFNPRSPYDTDCPPYFYNNGEEPRWPLYRVYADYTSRLSLMLSGGTHVCPVAFLYLGNSYHVGKSITPEELTTGLQDALFDCDWMPYDVFENDVVVDGAQLQLRKERYRVLIVPAAEVIPPATLRRAKEFFEGGGVVIGYGMLPSRSAALDEDGADLAALRRAIWGEAEEPSLKARRVSRGGGRSYFLPAEPTSRELQEVLVTDAGIHPTLEVLAGDPDDQLHVLHRVKEGRDVFFLCNQEHEGGAKRFELRLRAKGVPEIWDPLRGEITSIAHRLAEGGVVLELVLEPLQSQLIVFRENPGAVLEGVTRDPVPVHQPLAVERLASPSSGDDSADAGAPERSALEGCPWIWFPGDEGGVGACVRYFRGVLPVEPDRELTAAELELTADNDFQLFVNGSAASSGRGGYEDWRKTRTVDLKELLAAGANQLALTVENFDAQPNPAGLIGRWRLEYSGGEAVSGCFDGSWRASDREERGWLEQAFDDTHWSGASEIARYGDSPWGRFDDPGAGLTRSPVEADPFRGSFTLPAEWELKELRIYLELEDLDLGAAAVTLNGEYTGGFIGAPYRLEVTAHVVPGLNSLTIEPRAPGAARIVACD